MSFKDKKQIILERSQSIQLLKQKDYRALFVLESVTKNNFVFSFLQNEEKV